jgi:hypothetical protein
VTFCAIQGKRSGIHTEGSVARGSVSTSVECALPTPLRSSGPGANDQDLNEILIAPIIVSADFTSAVPLHVRSALISWLSVVRFGSTGLDSEPGFTRRSGRCPTNPDVRADAHEICIAIWLHLDSDTYALIADYSRTAPTSHKPKSSDWHPDTLSHCRQPDLRHPSPAERPQRVCKCASVTSNRRLFIRYTPAKIHECDQTTHLAPSCCVSGDGQTHISGREWTDSHHLQADRLKAPFHSRPSMTSAM